MGELAAAVRELGQLDLEAERLAGVLKLFELVESFSEPSHAFNTLCARPAVIQFLKKRRAVCEPFQLIECQRLRTLRHNATSSHHSRFGNLWKRAASSSPARFSQLACSPMT
jgi:hypothetical protein